LHRANASVVIALGLLAGASACATGRPHAALGWSLGGEAHVFIADDRFARDEYRQLTKRSLMDALADHRLVAVEAPGDRSATILSANGAAPARLTLARFHAPQACGSQDIVTELVLAFPPGGGAGHSVPSSHGIVVALLDAAPFAGAAGAPMPAMSTRDALSLVRRVAERAAGATRGPALGLLHAPTLDADQAADAGEIVPLRSQYAVGFRASFVRLVTETAIDTSLITGVAVTDRAMHRLQWVVRPLRVHVERGMIATNSGVRYSLRGAVASSGGGTLLLVDEIADVSARDSRATAVDVATRRVVATQPLALRCP
jgi:hypothetical protein